MGCWSESCAISGMEIRDGQACYLATLTTSTSEESLHAINVPPLLGRYDDYGGLDLEETWSTLDLKVGDNWRPEREESFFIDAQVFDFLPTLEREFCHHYREGAKTIADDLGYMAAGLMVGLREDLDAHAKAENESDACLRALMRRVSNLNRDYSSMFQGYLEAKELVMKGRMEPAELVKMVERSFTLQVGVTELRKNLAPIGVYHPQHNGEKALIPFYEFVLKEARTRAAARDLE